MAKKKSAPRSAPVAPAVAPVRTPARVALVVLGMHGAAQAGALARVLGALGADLGPNSGPDSGPDLGSLPALNDALLTSAGSGWDDWRAVNPDWYQSPRHQEYRIRAAQMLAQDFGSSGFFVLQDPRICRLVPFWADVLAECGTVAHVICLHQNPVQSAVLLSQRHGWPTSLGLLLWLRHVLDAEAATRGFRRSFVAHDALVSDWRPCIERIRADLRLHWPRQVDAATADIDAILSDAGGPDAGATAIPQVTGWIAEVQALFDRWVAQAEDTRDHARLDAIRTAFGVADATFDLVLAETRDRTCQSLQLTSELHRTSAQMADLQAEAAAHAANHATEQQMRGALDDRVAALDQALQAAQAEAAMHAANHASEQQMRGALDDRVAALDQALQAARAEAAMHAANHGSEQQMRGALEDRVAALDQALLAARAEAEAEMRQTLTAADRRYQALLQSHDALDAQHDTLTRTLDALTQDREFLRSALEQSRTEAHDCHQQIQADAERIASLEASLTQLETRHAALERNAERMARHMGAMTRQLLARISMTLDQRLHKGPEQGLDRPADMAPVPIQAGVQVGAQAVDSERAQLEDAYKAAVARIAELEQALQAPRRDVQARDMQYMTEQQLRAMAEVRIAELQQALQTARTDAEDLQARQAQALAAQAQLEAYNQALLRSTSWRLTAPLRYVVRKIRRQ